MTSIAPNHRILIIDDNESIHQDFRKILNPATSGKSALAQAAAEIFGQTMAAGPDEVFEIDSAFQGQEGLEKVRKALKDGRPYAMAFVDLRMPPGWDGIETISRIWQEYPDLQVVICTAYSDYSLDQIVGRLGRTDRMLLLKKPFDAIEVMQFADSLTEKWRLSRAAKAQMELLEEAVAERTRELREEQQKLIDSRKMELVAKLAGGIAHHFNSHLCAIIGNAELIQETAPGNSQASRSAHEICKSAALAAGLTHQILAFSRKQMLRPELLDLNVVIKSMQPIIQELVGSGINVTVSSDATQPWAMADPVQIGEVLIGLAENCREAMPSGGRITLETANVTFEKRDPYRDPEVAPGTYVVLSITDTGAGISEGTKPHIFEPFFSTKPEGEGKGLGLAMCYGILKQSDGHITFESQRGRGTTFKLLLPRTLPTSIPVKAKAASRAQTLIPAGTEVGNVLLVEPDAALRGVATTLLDLHGFAVTAVADGTEAISVAKKMSQLDLLIIETAMPSPDGEDVAGLLLPLHPRMRVIFTSTADLVLAGKGAALPAYDFIKKPYTPTTLATQVRATMQSQAAAVG